MKTEGLINYIKYGSFDSKQLQEEIEKQLLTMLEHHISQSDIQFAYEKLRETIEHLHVTLDTQSQADSFLTCPRFWECVRYNVINGFTHGEGVVPRVVYMINVPYPVTEVCNSGSGTATNLLSFSH